MKTTKNKQNIAFKKWLAKNNLSYGDFSQKTGVQFNTVIGWSRGAKPRKIFQLILKNIYPDCPLVRE